MRTQVRLENRLNENSVRFSRTGNNDELENFPQFHSHQMKILFDLAEQGAGKFSTVSLTRYACVWLIFNAFLKVHCVFRLVYLTFYGSPTFAN
jgi:hypothetical protein